MAMDNRSAAREKAAAARAAQQATERRRRQWLILGSVVVVVALVVGIGFLVQHRTATSNAALGTGPLVTPTGAVGADGLGIPYGADPAAKVTLLVYEDFRCPFCKAAEGMFESVYKPYAQDGKIKVEYHIVNLIDRNLGGTGSIQAGNAAACAQDAGKFEPFHDLLYANQPDETNDAYGSNSELIGLAKQVPGLDTASFAGCLDAATHGSWVIKNFNALSTLLGGAVATPYYAVDGKQYQLTNQPAADQQAAFKAVLTAAVTAAG
jgi:protein-disulfide isomerase